MNHHLEAAGLEKSYHGKKVVDAVSIRVGRGEIIGLLGPNGAGKTTTFSLILGQAPSDAGHVYLDGEEITHLPMYARARRGLCLLPQETSAFRKLTVRDNLLAVQELGRAGPAYRRRDTEETLVELGLIQLSHAKAYTLSGGERRRLEIARALITDPCYILLDEPFTGIDPLAIADLQEIILALRSKGLGLLITDHSVRETLRITDRAYIIDKGKILKHGTPEELVASFEVRQSYLGEGFILD